MTCLRAPLIFIGSMRSGTTVISEVVFRHEDLAWPSNYQERFPSVPSVNLVRRIFDNRLWRVHGQKPQLNPVPSVNRLLFKPAEAYAFWEYVTGEDVDFARGFLLDVRPTSREVHRIRSAFNALVRYQGRARLACKLTGPGRIGYLRGVFPDAMFVHITREEGPTLDSWLGTSFWRERGLRELWWRGAYSADEQEWARRHADEPALLAAMQHRRVIETTMREIASERPPYLSLRYEDFVADPLATVRRVLEFAGLSQSGAVEDYLGRLRIYDRNQSVHEASPQPGP